MVAGLAVAAVSVWTLVRTASGRRGEEARTLGCAAAPRRPVSPCDTDGPVSVLPTPERGSEWLRTTAALAGGLDPATRQVIVRRRTEALDELERRDPAGFSRWLAHGLGSGSNPADFVRSAPGRGPGAT